MSAQPSTTVEPLFQARGIVKRFGHVTALSGAVIPDSGTISLDNEEVNFKSPLEARRAGIETVYQDLAVAPESTLIRLDLPAPLSPITARISPG